MRRFLALLSCAATCGAFLASPPSSSGAPVLWRQGSSFPTTTTMTTTTTATMARRRREVTGGVVVARGSKSPQEEQVAVGRPELLIGVAVVGLCAVAANRLGVELPQGAQSRADLVAVAGLCAIALEGLSERDVRSREAEVVELKGVRGRGLAGDLAGADLELANWAAETILGAAPRVKTVFLWSARRGTLLRQGVLGAAPAVDATQHTFLKALEKADFDATYIPDLQNVPARAEFRYLPKNAAAALVIPFGGNDGDCAALVLACDQKRALSPRDIAWLTQVARRLDDAQFGSSSSSS